VLDVASVSKRARGENFPVASLAFPRDLRPHIRALYAYARLVDILGDELEGGPEARLAALDELEQEVEAAYRGVATWPVLIEVQPTIRDFDLPREPFLRLIEANRMDQRISEYESWDDLKQYCVHSAEPCGRLVLGVLRSLGDAHTVKANGGSFTDSFAGAPLSPGTHYLRVEYRQVDGWVELRVDIIRGSERSSGSPGPH